MQTLSPNPPPSPNPMSSIAPPQPSSLPFPPAGRGSHHRRAQSEVAFRIPDDLGDPMAAGAGFDEAEDDLFCTFMDIDKIGSGRLEESGSGSEGGDRTAGDGGDGNAGPSRPKHRHSVSVDGVGEVMEAKKAMAADKLAELAAVDPKRVKRILANRQSAARSKERKARYISELERKVQTLQTEATTLSAQLTLFQRDTSGLTSENTELKLRLQAMEQQAQLRDALNNALKHEVERLKVATGETVNPSDSYDMGLHQTPLNSLFFTSSHQQMDVHQGFQSQQHFPQSQPTFSNHQMLAHHHALSDIMMQQDPLGRMQELDISKGSHIVKSESSSISASESSSTF